jgi:hypothetical protein
MAFVTWEDTVSNGSQTDYNIIFPFLDRDHVEVKFDGTVQASTSFTFLSDSQIRLDAAAGNGVTVRVGRNTPQTVLTDFQTGVIVSEGDLDDSYLQHLYIDQELQDNWDEAIATAITVSVPGVVEEGDYVNNSVRYKDSAAAMANAILGAGELLGRGSTGEIRNLTGSEAILQTTAVDEVIALVIALG